MLSRVLLLTLTVLPACVTDIVELEDLPTPACACRWVPKGGAGACRLVFEGCVDDAGVASDCEERPPRPAACWADAGS